MILIALLSKFDIFNQIIVNRNVKIHSLQLFETLKLFITHAIVYCYMHASIGTGTFCRWTIVTHHVSQTFCESVSWT